MLLTIDTTPMAGIFLVMVTIPWPNIVGVYAGDSALINGLLLLGGGLINGIVLYGVTAFIVSTIRNRKKP